MKSQARLLKMVKDAAPMTRGRLCVLKRTPAGGKFYHLQYRRRTKLFQKYVPLDQVAAYERTTAAFREFMEAVDAYVNEMSRLSMNAVEKEAKRARRKSKKAR